MNILLHQVSGCREQCESRNHVSIQRERSRIDGVLDGDSGRDDFHAQCHIGHGAA